VAEPTIRGVAPLAGVSIKTAGLLAAGRGRLVAVDAVTSCDEGGASGFATGQPSR